MAGARRSTQPHKLSSASRLLNCTPLATALCTSPIWQAGCPRQPATQRIFNHQGTDMAGMLNSLSQPAIAADAVNEGGDNSSGGAIDRRI